MNKRNRFLLIITVLILAAIACASFGGGNVEEPTSTTVPTATTIPTEISGTVPLPDATDPVQEDTDAEVQEEPQTAEEGTTENEEPAPPASPADDGPAVLNLEDPALYQMPEANTFQIKIINSFEGVDAAGAPVKGDMQITSAQQVDPEKMMFEVTGSGTPEIEEMGAITMIMIEDESFIIAPGLGCISGLGTDDTEEFTSLADSSDMLKGEAKRIKPDEKINGVDTYVYALTEENMMDQGSAEIETMDDGKLYIAKNGGYIVRLYLKGRGMMEPISGDPDLVGDIIFQMDIFGLDEAIPEIKPPEDCGGFDFGLGDGEGGGTGQFPIPEDAADLFDLGDIVTFSTGLTEEEAIAFYKTNMGETGCANPQETDLGGEGTMLVFSGCPTGDVQMIIGQEEGSTVVTIISLGE